MKFAIIDNNIEPMKPDSGRGAGFAQALAGWEFGLDYEFVRYPDIVRRDADLMQCRGLILSGSAFDLAKADDSFDRGTYQKMIPQYGLLQRFRGPVLGICFGHQMLALADEFDPERTTFGSVTLRNMRRPRNEYTVLSCRIGRRLPFVRPGTLWVQYHHKQEVVRNDALLERFEIVAGSEQCAVEAMRHRRREWYSVQFHPEIGKDTKEGVKEKHQAATKDGHRLISDFAAYCLRDASDSA